MQGMSQYGRNGDTMMAHVAPGEMVVPQEVLQSNPQVARGLGMAFADAGADPLRYTVGSGQNSINPVTGEPEFFLGDLLKKGLKYLLLNKLIPITERYRSIRKIMQIYQKVEF